MLPTQHRWQPKEDWGGVGEGGVLQVFEPHPAAGAHKNLNFQSWQFALQCGERGKGKGTVPLWEKKTVKFPFAEAALQHKPTTA